MFPLCILMMALALVVPCLPADVAPPPSSESRLPVVLAAAPHEPAAVDAFDAAAMSRQVVDGTAARLRARGIAVASSVDGGFLVGRRPADTGSGATAAAHPVIPAGDTVALTVGFGSATNRWASGTETRFGGEGDAAWRLASQVQRNLASGLRDVVGYDTYDRGILEMDGPGPLSGDGPAGPWVAAFPLFTTNPRERALLEWPETVDLLASALANALYDYLGPSLRTPPRSPLWGWRSVRQWQPVSPKAITQADSSSRLALTFDGGASSAPTPAILKALRDNHIRATMFMTAEFVEKNPELVVQMAKDGHEFGNHSSTHPDMTGLSDQAIIAELDRLETSIGALTGKSTRPWFRPPFGAYDDRVVQVAADRGYYTILWTADSADWRDDVSAATVERRLLTYASPGAILIEHLGSPQSALVLADVLAALKERGFTFGTLSEVLEPVE